MPKICYSGTYPSYFSPTFIWQYVSSGEQLCTGFSHPYLNVNELFAHAILTGCTETIKRAIIFLRLCVPGGAQMFRVHLGTLDLALWNPYPLSDRSANLGGRMAADRCRQGSTAESSGHLCTIESEHLFEDAQRAVVERRCITLAKSDIQSTRQLLLVATVTAAAPLDGLI
ncbi:hypothetical protein E2P81_ATG03038 [Venturia nashicola]|uniref:Uncharacterized protein n=1 Tax=Venturia nashicola TaxID=86259 RepID=A0A4Z1PDZ6_9PEZI|nr:hypothetical protein E6O75_ATG03102 [Venturia nashicola]TLD36149.1 hypothetical protein E2P81_ATG03038 [Venturia nashicola]